MAKSLETIQKKKTPLELQINSFVKKMVIIGVVPSSSLSGAINYFSIVVFPDSFDQRR